MEPVRVGGWGVGGRGGKHARWYEGSARASGAARAAASIARVTSRFAAAPARPTVAPS